MNTPEISIIDASGQNPRITVVPGSRVTVKIPSGTSQLDQDVYVKMAEHARDNYIGIHTIRGHVRYSPENGYNAYLQTGSKDNYVVIYRDGVISNNFNR